MAEMIFNTYVEAASYAKQRAQETGSPMKFERHNEQWIVFDMGSPQKSGSHPIPSLQHRSAKKYDYWEQQRKEKEEEQKAIERWKVQKAQYAPCYACGGKGGGDGRTCARCLGRGYLMAEKYPDS